MHSTGRAVSCAMLGMALACILGVMSASSGTALAVPDEREHTCIAEAGAAAQQRDAARSGHGQDTGRAPVKAPSPVLASSPPVARLDEKLGAVIPAGILLRDEEGKPVDIRLLMDAPVLLAPALYHERGSDASILDGIVNMLPQLGLAAGKEYRVFAVSLDEANTPEQAARTKSQYVAKLGDGFPADAWRFLTGDSATIARLMDVIGVRYARQGDDFASPVVLVVVSSGGQVTRYLYGNTPASFDISMALAEAGQGSGKLSLRSALSRLYVYDPEKRRYTLDYMMLAGIALLVCAAAVVVVLVRDARRK